MNPTHWHWGTAVVQVVVDYVALWTVRRAYFWTNWVQGKDRRVLLKQHSLSLFLRCTHPTKPV